LNRYNSVRDYVADVLGRLLGEGTFGKVVDCKDLERWDWCFTLLRN